MSAAGTTTLASGAGLRRATGQQQQQASGAGEQPPRPPLGFISAAAAVAHGSSTSSVSSSSSASSSCSSAAAATPAAQPSTARYAPSTGYGPQQPPAVATTAAATSASSSSCASSLAGGSLFGPASGGEVFGGVSSGGPFAKTQPALAAAMGELQLAGGETQQQLEQSELLEEQQREANRKLRLQLYVFVSRCISYPFNAKQQMATGDHRQQLTKLRRGQLEQIVQAHGRFLAQAREQQSFSGPKCPHYHLKLLNESQLKQLDELYERAHHTFDKRFLRNEKMKLLVESECCSQQDLRDLFRQNAQRVLKQSQLFTQAQQAQRAAYMSNQSGAMGAASSGGQREQRYASVRQEQQEATLAASGQLLAQKELILNSWLLKFESVIRESSDDQILEAAAGQLASAGANCSGRSGEPPVGLCGGPQQQQQMTKEQLYQMFQNILQVKKFEHQLLYNALQLDSSDEQAAAIRRELDGRVARIAELERNKKLLPKFVLKEMESLFMDEARMSVNKLMINLDSLPVLKGGGSLAATGQLGGGATSGLGAGGSGSGAVDSPAGSPALKSSNVATQVVYGGLSKFRRYNSR